VLPQDDVRPGKARIIPIGDHAAGAPAHVLARLKDHQYGARPCVAVLGQHAGGTHQPGHVQVMATGMGHTHLSTVLIGSTHGAGIGQARVLSHGQRIHVGAQHHGSAGAIAQHSHDTGDADVSRNLIAERLQVVCRDARGAHLLHGKLGMLVQILVNAFQLRQQRAAAAPECLGEWVHGRLPARCACATVPHSVAACHHRPRSMRKTLLAAHECRWGQAAQRDAAGNAHSDAKLGDQEGAADRRSGA